MIGLILAAGEGKRLNRGLAENVIKPLIKIDGKYLIEYSLQNCSLAGIKTVVIVVNSNNKSAVCSAIGDKFNGMTVIYAVQTKQNGLINAVLSASVYLNDSVMLQLADEIFIRPGISDCVDFYNGDSDFVVTYVCENDEKKIKNNFLIEIDKNKNVVNCIEKPNIVINNLKGTGICFFNTECIELLKKNYDYAANYPDNLCDYFNYLVKNGKTGKAFCIAKEEININTVEEFEFAQNRLKIGKNNEK